MARPRKTLDVEQLIKCAEKQWSITEIAAFFRVSTDTIHRRYAAEVELGRQNGKAKLRDLLWHRAISGSDAILKHMCEHYLGQTSRQQIDFVNIPDEKLREIPDEKLTPEIERRLRNGQQ
jgi:hypothetical protein